MSLQNACDKLSCTPFSYQTWPGRADLLCHDRIHVGLFFDGTGNNVEIDEPAKKHSNVARLHKAYKEVPVEGYFRYYIPGVGTPFPDIGEMEGSVLGLGAAKGGEARILWAMLQVLNSLAEYMHRRDLIFTRDQIRALCTNGHHHVITTDDYGRVIQTNISDADQAALKSLGRSAGLVGDVPWSERRSFLLMRANAFIAAIRKSKPTPCELLIDIFGFSRGAALARVCANWLIQHLMVGNKVAMLPAQIRFMGLFDTVASVGVPASIDGGGHYSWASPDNLRIPEKVSNCVHFVAAHEGRASFPVDSVREGAHYPVNCKEVVFPGAHSDVGGGYAPGEQGRGMLRTNLAQVREAAYAVKLAQYEQDRLRNPGLIRPHKEGIPQADFLTPVYLPDDGYKLSQWPLNTMYMAARKGEVPLLDISEEAEDRLRLDLPNHFSLAPHVKKSAEAYFSQSDIALNMPVDQHLREHRLVYLAWRYAVRKDFMALPGSQRAEAHDQKDLTEGNVILTNQVDEGSALQLAVTLPYPSLLLMAASLSTVAAGRQLFRHGQYKEIMAAIKRRQVRDDVATFFDAHVHDSYAGFIPLPFGKREPHGYVRYRTCFIGNHPPCNIK